MAITDTLTAVKEYFLDWHSKHYEGIHEKPLKALSNNAADDNKLVTNKAVREGIIQYSNILDTPVSVNNKTSKTLQTTLDDFDSTLDTINSNYVKKTDVANYTETVGLFDNYSSNVGFQPSVTTGKDGLMTWKEKYDLHYIGEWKKFSNTEIGVNAPQGSHLWINPVLRIGYFHYWNSKSSLLKDAYKDTQSTVSKTLMWNQPDEIIARLKPMHDCWAATNYPYIHMGVNEDGYFTLSSDKPVKKTLKLLGTVIYMYNDQRPSEKIRI